MGSGSFKGFSASRLALEYKIGNRAQKSEGYFRLLCKEFAKRIQKSGWENKFMALDFFSRKALPCILFLDLRYSVNTLHQMEQSQSRPQAVNVVFQKKADLFR
ncbi:hypothetical protein [Mycoavidus cysteinexigens]|uniref:hypothetical protein n=1 Tax=Mycoavidus cysteinexigens TaxID=1553431 RepID=UPI0005EF093F|nr:hypothetical protein [Mycoavidus cysteinexigens]GAM51817.1 hypothetical protein EBME_0280 [bacterium endosymbiont of Mortierella elongata FMR23-6]